MSPDRSRFVGPLDGGPATIDPETGRIVIRVDPARGSDDALGSRDAPVATLGGALARVSQHRAEGRAVTVELAAGVHWMTEPAVLTAAHSGTADAPLIVTAESGPGGPAQVALAGGTPLLGDWEPVAGSPLARLPIPSGRTFRQLFVDAERKPRARTEFYPDGGLRTTEEVSRIPCLPFETGVEPTGYQLDRFRVDVAVPTDLEFVSLENWRMFRCPVTGVSAGGSRLELNNFCWRRSVKSGAFGVGRLSWLENAREFLDSPGEWYLDSREGYLYYYPHSPAQVSADPASFIAPLAETLLRFEGQPGSPVAHVRVEHLNLAFTSWEEPSSPDGYTTVQAGTRLEDCPACDRGERAEFPPGAIELSHAEDITITQGTLHRLGGVGIRVGNATKRVAILDNVITNVASGALIVGGTSPAPPTPGEEIEGHRIVGNLITHTGRDYSDSVGIFLGYVRDVEVRHNTLTDLPYTGISVGWGWSDERLEWLGDNLIAANLVRRSAQTLVDGAGIYTLSRQDGTEIRDNYIDGVGLGLRVGDRWGTRRCCLTPNVPIYFDTGSARMRVVNNVSRDAPFLETFSPPRPSTFGLTTDSAATACGLKACDMDVQDNRTYRPGNAQDDSVVNNAGRPADHGMGPGSGGADEVPYMCGGGGGGGSCTVQPTETPWRVFRSAHSISVPDANAGWSDFNRAVQFDQSGASVRFTAPRGVPPSRGGSCTATANYQSTLLRLFNAGLDVPPNATITGVRVEITMKTAGLRPSLRTVHLWGPRANQTPVESPSAWSGGEPGMLTTEYRPLTFGAPNYGWGLGASLLRPALVNHEWFSVRLGFDASLECGGADSLPQVDAARVKVFYTVCR